MPRFRVLICVPNRAACESARSICCAGDVSHAASSSSSYDVHVECASILDVATDFIVSPGNSFGQMNGGLDGLINTHFSRHMAEHRFEDVVRRVIARDFHGELHVGQALVLRGDRRARWVVYTPTLRVPEDVSGSTNAYIAMRAALCATLDAISSGAAIPPSATRCTTICAPLLCAGAGCMSVETACRQMLEACRTVLDDSAQKLSMLQWPELHAHHRSLLRSPTGAVAHAGPNHCAHAEEARVSKE